MNKICLHCQHASFQGAFKILGKKNCAISCLKPRDLTEKHMTIPPHRTCINGNFKRSNPAQIQSGKDYFKKNFPDYFNQFLGGENA